MTMRDEDREPDYIRRRATRARFGETLLVEGMLCALAVGLLVLMPAIASDAPQARPAVQATYRVCTPVILPGDGEPSVEPATPIPPQPACAASAREMRLVEETGHPDSANGHRLQ